MDALARNIGRHAASYFKGTAYIIDVSQSVEHDHPHALDFLRKDCTNVTGPSARRARARSAERTAR